MLRRLDSTIARPRGLVACAWSVWASLALASGLFAQEPVSGPPFVPLPENPLHEGVLTGAWGGWRSQLEQRGLSLGLNGIVDTSWPLSGGLDDRVTTRALWDVSLEGDLERLVGLRGGSCFIQAYSQSGRDASEQVGDAQAFSNIDGPNVTQLSELWYQHVTPGEALRLKLGKSDANSEFAATQAGLPFLHSSAGFSPTIFVFPSYPDPAVGLNAFVRAAAGWQLGLGLYNAARDGAVSGQRGMTAEFEAAFLLGELDRRWDSLAGLGSGRLAFGVWTHSGVLDRFDGGQESGTEGAYAMLEQGLLHEHPGRDDDEQGLVGFLQWGIADGDVSSFEHHLGVGFLYTGLIPHRDTWHSGLYLSRVEFTDEPAAGFGDDELAIELFQEFGLLPGLALKPDLQLIVDPSGRKDVGDAWVFTLRLELSL